MMFVICCLFSVFCAIDARRIVDLTHTFDNEAPKYPLDSFGAPDFVYFNMTQILESYFGDIWIDARRVEFYEHQGTHIDSPSHIGKGRQSLEQIPPERLIGPGVVIDVRDKVKDNPDYAVTVEDILDSLNVTDDATNSMDPDENARMRRLFWIHAGCTTKCRFPKALTQLLCFKAHERKHGTVPPNAIVCMNSGWALKYPNARLVFATENVTDPSTFHYPGWSLEACELLLQKRQINVLGVDSPSIDPAQPGGLPCHVYLQNNNVPLLEYVAHLDSIPVRDTMMVLGAMKVRSGSGGPTRVFAIIDDDEHDMSDSTGNSSPLVALVFVLLFIHEL